VRVPILQDEYGVDTIVVLLPGVDRRRRRAFGRPSTPGGGPPVSCAAL